MYDHQNEIALSNHRYEHFGLFKKSMENFPTRTFDIIIKYGSSDLKASPYIGACAQLHTFSLANSFFKVAIGSTIAVFLTTLIFHRHRALVLTAPGGFRSLLTKYVPVWLGYGFYQFYYPIKVPTDRVNEDFGEIQD